MSNDPDLAVAIVNYRSSGLIRRLLGAWSDELPGASRLGQIVVVDNDPGDMVVIPNAAELRAHQVNLRANLGYAAGVNAACRDMDARYILLLNPDAEISIASIESLAAIMDSDPTLGAIAPLHLDHEGQVTNPYRRIPSWLDLASHRTRLQRFEWARARARGYVYQELDQFEWGSQLIEVDQPPASCLLLRRDAIGRPIMDERFPILFNDVDLSKRLKVKGWRTVVAASVSCRHVPATSTRYLGLRGEAEFWVAAYRFVRKWEGRLPAAALRSAVIIELLWAAFEHPQRREENRLAARALLGNSSLFDRPTAPDPVRRFWPEQLAASPTD